MVHEIQPAGCDRRTDIGALVIGFRFTLRNPKNDPRSVKFRFWLVKLFFKDSGEVGPESGSNIFIEIKFLIPIFIYNFAEEMSLRNM